MNDKPEMSAEERAKLKAELLAEIKEELKAEEKVEAKPKPEPRAEPEYKPRREPIYADRHPTKGREKPLTHKVSMGAIFKHLALWVLWFGPFILAKLLVIDPRLLDVRVHEQFAYLLLSIAGIWALIGRWTDTWPYPFPKRKKRNK